MTALTTESVTEQAARLEATLARLDEGQLPATHEQLVDVMALAVARVEANRFGNGDDEVQRVAHVCGVLLALVDTPTRCMAGVVMDALGGVA